MEPPTYPETKDRDPISAALLVLKWRCHQLIYALSPDGFALAAIRWAGRLAMILAGPLLLVFAVLFAVRSVLDQMGSILTSTIGVGLVLLAIAAVVTRTLK
jgi:hypothetical protein